MGSKDTGLASIGRIDHASLHSLLNLAFTYKNYTSVNKRQATGPVALAFYYGRTSHQNN